MHRRVVYGLSPHAHQAKVLLHPQNEIFRLSCNEKAYLSFFGGPVFLG